MNVFTLTFLPYVGMIAILCMATAYEIRDLPANEDSGFHTISGRPRSGSSSNTSSSGTTSGGVGITSLPKNGWPYLTDSSETIICPQRGHRYKVYHVSGRQPDMTMRRDRIGIFFTIHASNDAQAQQMVDMCYRK